MGNILARMVTVFQKMPDQKVLLLGLDGAGKTTIIYRMKLAETVHSSPTIGFNVEGITMPNGLEMTVWDIGGQNLIRKMWHHYFRGANAMIFVLDSADRERLSEAAEELWKVVDNEELSITCNHVLILANKQDLPNAMSPREIIKAMGLYSRPNLKWKIQPCVATTGDGLPEGMDWLAKELATAWTKS